MSLTSFLLDAGASKGKSKAIDAGLDDLFRSTINASEVDRALSQPSSLNKAQKKRKDAPAEISSSPTPAKKPKPSADDNSRRNKNNISARPHEPSKVATLKTAKFKVKPVESHPGSDLNSYDGEEESDNHAGVSSPAKESQATQSSDESDEEGDPSQLVHESVTRGEKSSKGGARKAKYVPAEETPAQRDARTIFVGNVPVEVVKSRPLQKQFRKHILSFVPTAKIESTRFRSVAFQKPTTKLPSDDPPSSSSKPSKDGREHDRERAASWRGSKSKTDEDASADVSKTFLTPKEKKRVAFIKQDIHSGVDSVNAYVVFAHPSPIAEGKVQNATSAMDPYEAAKLAIRKADGSVFMKHTLRVDSAMKEIGKATELGSGDANIAGDPRATVFVGNLDFASKEEDLRAFFEGLMVVEKGPGVVSPVASEDEHDGEGQDSEAGEVLLKLAQNTWVKRVRIIRDKDTLLGKGFGYVQFNDRSCVDEVLALPVERLKFAKRKLRVQRCKTLPGATKPSKVSSTRPTTAKSKSERPITRPRNSSATEVPKGDPTLGAKIASLSKDERKKVKASDADRIARRLAKKKAKALADQGVKSHDKERERVRKPKDSLRTTRGEKGKKRVRSNKALMKMNTKK